MSKAMTKAQLEKLYPQPGGRHKDYTLKQLLMLHRAHAILEQHPNDQEASQIVGLYEHECQHWGVDPMTGPMTDEQARAIIAAAIGLAVATPGAEREKPAYKKFVATMEEVFPGCSNSQ